MVSAEILPDGAYSVVQDLSSFTWEGKEASGNTHTGNIDLYKGSLKVMNSSFSSAFIGINMNSINCTDLEGSAKERLEGHLKSEDFFATDSHQIATLNVNAIKTANNVSKASGILTIKGISQPITFPTTVFLDGDNIVIDGTLRFDRSNFDVRFRSDKWYSDLGDKLIYNDIDLTYHIVASPR